MVLDRITSRCKWCNLSNPLYVEYHDHEWGKPVHDETRLFEMLILEGFQAGLSWECVLNKREAFRKAFGGFDYKVIAGYSQEKLDSLAADPGIIRNRLKIKAAVTNAKIFIQIQKESGSFDNYLLSFTKGKVIKEYTKTTNSLSDAISKDLRKRGMKFVGSTIIYSFLQATGSIDSHSPECDLYPGK